MRIGSKCYESNISGFISCRETSKEIAITSHCDVYKRDLQRLFIINRYVLNFPLLVLFVSPYLKDRLLNRKLKIDSVGGIGGAAVGQLLLSATIKTV